MSKVDALVKATGVDLVELTSYRTQAEGLSEFLSMKNCRTPEAEVWFSQQLSNVRGLLKVIEEKRTSITKPLGDAKRAVDAMFSPATKPLKECEEIIRAKLAEPAQLRLEAQAAALALAAAAAAQGDSDAVLAAVATLPTVVATEGSSSGWKWTVADFNKEEMAKTTVGMHYLRPDVDALEKLCRFSKELAPSVPGVTFRKVATVRAK